jgi:Acyltransferase
VAGSATRTAQRGDLRLDLLWRRQLATPRHDHGASASLGARRGVFRVLYALVRLVLVPLLRVYCRMRISGAEHIPKRGPAIIAANHKDVWDAFFIALATNRHVRFMTAS